MVTTGAMSKVKTVFNVSHFIVFSMKLKWICSLIFTIYSTHYLFLLNYFARVGTLCNLSRSFHVWIRVSNDCCKGAAKKVTKGAPHTDSNICSSVHWQSRESTIFGYFVVSNIHAPLLCTIKRYQHVLLCRQFYRNLK